MRLGVLITSIGNFGQKGFYNAQEIGLAKELDKLFDEVIVYKAVPQFEEKSIELIENCEHSEINQIPVKSRGINGIWDCSVMDATLDALLYFSDTQLAVPKVYRWCCKNDIKMYPYIGVIESHSTNKIKKLLINVMFQKNISVYRQCTCFVKTPTVCKKMKRLGIKDVVVAPVGLDLSLLHECHEKNSGADFKKKYGFSESDRVLLFIGRLIEEKQPIRMIEILSEIREKDKAYKLFMVGNGELKAAVEQRIRKLGLSDDVRMIERISNNEIWELYLAADAFINLNQQEIFGMAILEAMYYGCKVVAWHAPGPNLIIEDGKSGWLAEKNEEVIERILDTTDVTEEAHRRVLHEFTWESSAKRILSVIGD